jgi:hypothetical protein
MGLGMHVVLMCYLSGLGIEGRMIESRIIIIEKTNVYVLYTTLTEKVMG